MAPAADVGFEKGIDQPLRRITGSSIPYDSMIVTILVALLMCCPRSNMNVTPVVNHGCGVRTDVCPQTPGAVEWFSGSNGPLPVGPQAKRVLPPHPAIISAFSRMQLWI
jgi:hypothetical protein